MPISCSSKTVLSGSDHAAMAVEEKPKSAKMLKLVNDPCFGEQYELIDQCSNCWIKKSCHVRFRNRKP